VPPSKGLPSSIVTVSSNVRRFSERDDSRLILGDAGRDLLLEGDPDLE
jgi:hypothetical protein